MEENNNIKQSLVLTELAYSSNIYMQRIITHIIKANQYLIQGEIIGGKDVKKFDKTFFSSRIFRLSIEDIDINKNYTRVYDAFEELSRQRITFTSGKKVLKTSFITSILYDKGTGEIQFSMNADVYELFTNFVKGFRESDIEVCQKLNSPYAIRMYQYISQQSKSFEKTYEDFYTWWGLDKKNYTPSSFKTRILNKVKAELDDKSPYTFDYTVMKKSFGKGEIGVTITPKRNPNFNQLGPAAKITLKDKIVDILCNQFKFKDNDIAENADLLNLTVRNFGDDILPMLDNIYKNAKGSKKEYLITSLRNNNQLLNEFRASEIYAKLNRPFNVYSIFSDDDPLFISLKIRLDMLGIKEYHFLPKNNVTQDKNINVEVFEEAFEKGVSLQEIEEMLALLICREDIIELRRKLSDYNTQKLVRLAVMATYKRIKFENEIRKLPYEKDIF